MRGAASSRSDQVQERARSGGCTLHTAGDRTLRLAEKTTDGASRVKGKIGDGRGGECYRESGPGQRPRSQVRNR